MTTRPGSKYIIVFVIEFTFLCLTDDITCHLAGAFIQSDLQLIRLSRRHTPWSNVGLRALLKGPTAVQILSWPQLGSNHQPCRSKSSSLTTTLQATGCHCILPGAILPSKRTRRWGFYFLRGLHWFQYTRHALKQFLQV